MLWMTGVEKKKGGEEREGEKDASEEEKNEIMS